MIRITVQFFTLSFFVLTVGFAYAEKNKVASLPSEPVDRCSLVLQEGSCKGNFHVFYFDNEAGKCREAQGCYGTLFNNMEECREICEKGENAESTEASPSEALLLYLNQGNGDPEKVRHFIESGADVNYSDKQYRNTPLHNATHFGQVEIVKILLAQGADVDVKDNRGDTPLLMAVDEGHTETAIMLINNGADINMTGSHGGNPIHVAVAYGFVGIVKNLVEKGANLHVRDRRGKTPYDLAEQSGNMEIMGILNKHRMLKI